MLANAQRAMVTQEGHTHALIFTCLHTTSPVQKGNRSSRRSGRLCMNLLAPAPHLGEGVSDREASAWPAFALKEAKAA